MDPISADMSEILAPLYPSPLSDESWPRSPCSEPTCATPHSYCHLDRSGYRHPLDPRLLVRLRSRTRMRDVDHPDCSAEQRGGGGDRDYYFENEHDQEHRPMMGTAFFAAITTTASCTGLPTWSPERYRGGSATCPS